ncbi:NAD(P)H-hydrate dehydratase [Variovorax sp. OV329]|uniref:NAD(P)H-hydrate dehydratase n=1 Tax=Variovorax sp. OV329 TaxID=1882825 RepID=UPI0008E5FBC8|nr:NAD(P)H-hydrate dehydratase [Variovorax sp. OV329]SFM58757.1 yjeF C-terminal region, hydroxyethylthiazole kinase-related [Variovorax sp. OV329]
MGSPVRALTRSTLRRWPLPDPGNEADKETRGQVLVVAGSPEIPGAAILAGEAALRAGAGKLMIAAPREIAQGLALAVPEARVIGLPQARNGDLDAAGAQKLLQPLAAGVRALVVGPGMQDEARCVRLVNSLLPAFRHAPVLLDAMAMCAARDSSAFSQPVILTPHAGEMANLCGMTKEEVAADPLAAVRGAADAFNACVALKGAQTYVCLPGQPAWRFDGGSPGLATSGSGDALAGLIGGLAARGLSVEGACAWGVTLHARAGHALARRMGPLGYLARELSHEVPAQLRMLGDGSH